MDWSDYYTEACSEQPASAESKITFDSIINLWIQFSHFEISLHQFKKAVEVFEKAIIDPIGCKSSLLFRSYAKFCIERKKLANAQNVYIKALCAGFATDENELLWEDFLSLMHIVNPKNELTISDLYEAVKGQAVVGGKLAIPLELNALNHSMNESDISMHLYEEDASIDVIESKESENENNEYGQSDNMTSVGDTIVKDEPTSDGVMKMEVEEEKSSGGSRGASPVPMETTAEIPTSAASTAHAEVSQEAAAERQYAAPDDLDEVAGLTPEQIIRIYSARPPMLFTALHKEPTASGIAALTTENPGAAELEAMLGCKLASLPTRTPNMHQKPAQYGTWTTADRYLDLIESMWAAQALKERHFDSWITDMRNMHIEQVTFFYI